MNQTFKNYKKIFKKYNYSLSSEKELLEIIRNIEALAELFCEFEKKSKNIKNKKEHVSKYKTNK